MCGRERSCRFTALAPLAAPLARALHAPSIAPVSRGEGVQATGGPEQVWRVLKIRRSGCSRVYPAAGGPRVPVGAAGAVYVVEVVVALQRTCSRARPRLAVITWGRAVEIGVAAV